MNRTINRIGSPIGTGDRNGSRSIAGSAVYLAVGIVTAGAAQQVGRIGAAGSQCICCIRNHTVIGRHHIVAIIFSKKDHRVIAYDYRVIIVYPEEVATGILVRAISTVDMVTVGAIMTVKAGRARIRAGQKHGVFRAFKGVVSGTVHSMTTITMGHAACVEGETGTGSSQNQECYADDC